MQTDKTTLTDLSIFHREEEQSVFYFLDCTTSHGGKEWLKFMLAHPYNDVQKISETQQTLQIILQKVERWPSIITNGTVMVVEKFFDSPVEDIPRHPNDLSGFLYKLLNGHDYSLISYTINHFIDFAIGIRQIVHFFEGENVPLLLSKLIQRVKMLIAGNPVFLEMMHWEKAQKPSTAKLLGFAQNLRRHFKQESLELVDIYSKLDAYYGMAVACKKFNFHFPEIQKSKVPFIEAEGLYHMLLPEPVSYDLQMNRDTNFLFLTGANMAGKSTFIKAVGVAVYLAHIGMGVPAQNMKLSLFDGLLSNIQVEDNITRGESYFFNEVQRIKKTIDKINDGRNWLILIDELFKGTNVQDAMKCSTVVIEGLRKMSNALFILSTHLYEIGESLRQYPNIRFNYFETLVQNGQLVFSYQLKDGISNDRLGYLILKREGVVDLLETL